MGSLSQHSLLVAIPSTLSDLTIQEPGGISNTLLHSSLGLSQSGRWEGSQGPPHLWEPALHTVFNLSTEEEGGQMPAMG